MKLGNLAYISISDFEDSLAWNGIYIYISLSFLFFKYKFIYFNWRLITLQYCIGFAIHQYESATGVHFSWFLCYAWTTNYEYYFSVGI